MVTWIGDDVNIREGEVFKGDTKLGKGALLGGWQLIFAHRSNSYSHTDPS